MKYSHINLYWKDIDEKLMNYIDRYFKIRFNEVSNEEKILLRSNEKGALQGYMQTFDDKNGKWIDRVFSICEEISKMYINQGLECPLELTNFKKTINPLTSIEDRIKVPLKALYKLTYQELLKNDEPIIKYDEDGNIDRINLNPEQLKMAINLFALTGTMANRIAHSIANLEEGSEEYDYKHKMMTYLLIATYDYNRISNEKINCKFGKLPSKSDGHSYPAFTAKLRDIGKISLHFGGTMRRFRYVV